MEYPQPPAVGFHASLPPSVPHRPPAPPVAVFPAAAPTPSATGVKRKWQGNHVIHGAMPAAAPTSFTVLPPVSVAGSRTSASSTPSGGWPKSQAKGPRKKAVATRGWAHPPPNPAAHVPRDPVNSIGVHKVFEETSESYNVHTSYAKLLEENEVNIMSAPLDTFDSGMQADGEAEVEERGNDNDDVEELEKDEFDASQAKFGKQTGNYTKMEDLCLIRAWESVSLDAVTGKDQTGKKYWQRIEDNYHKLMSIPSSRSLKSLQGRWDVIKKTCARWSGCLEQVRNAPPDGHLA